MQAQIHFVLVMAMATDDHVAFADAKKRAQVLHAHSVISAAIWHV